MIVSSRLNSSAKEVSIDSMLQGPRWRPEGGCMGAADKKYSKEELSWCPKNKHEHLSSSTVKIMQQLGATNPMNRTRKASRSSSKRTQGKTCATTKNTVAPIGSMGKIASHRMSRWYTQHRICLAPINLVVASRQCRFKQWSHNHCTPSSTDRFDGVYKTIPNESTVFTQRRNTGTQSGQRHWLVQC